MYVIAWLMSKLNWRYVQVKLKYDYDPTSEKAYFQQINGPDLGWVTPDPLNRNAIDVHVADFVSPSIVYHWPDVWAQFCCIIDAKRTPPCSYGETVIILLERWRYEQIINAAREHPVRRNLRAVA